MEIFRRESTRKTPGISFDPGSGNFEISGRSFNDDSVELFEELFIWLDKYIEVPLRTTSLTFDTDYFNSSSYKCYVQIIKKLENIQDSNHEVNIKWLYDKDDEENKEAGENLKEITMLPVNLVPKNIKSER